MRLTIPITGTVLVEGTLSDGKLTGHPDDPIRLIAINLGNVSWQLLDVDLDSGVAVIEVYPPESVYEPVLDSPGNQKVNERGELVYQERAASEAEKLSSLQYAQDMIFSHTKDELYDISKSSRLKRPFKK